MTQQNIRRRTSDVDHPEHITAEWVLLAIKTAFGDRECSHECVEVATIKQEQKEHKELLVELARANKDQTKATVATMWTVILAMAGFIGTLVILLIGK